MYVCPSRLEGFGLTLIEAMWYGKPIIASNVGSIREVLGQYNSGVLIDPGNWIQFSKEILKLLEYGSEYNQQGKRIVKEYFDWEKCAKQTESIYRALMRKDEFN